MTAVDELEREAPLLVAELRRRYTPAVVARVVELLEAEGVPTADLRAIALALVTINGASPADSQRCILFAPNTANFWGGPKPAGAPSPELLADTVRLSLKRPISQRFGVVGDWSRDSSEASVPSGTNLRVLLVSRDLEERLLRPEPDPDAATDLLEAVREEREIVLTRPEVVVLTTVELRRRVRDILAPDFPTLPVVCFQELSPELNIEPLARLG